MLNFHPGCSLCSECLSTNSYEFLKAQLGITSFMNHQSNLSKESLATQGCPLPLYRGWGRTKLESLLGDAHCYCASYLLHFTEVETKAKSGAQGHRERKWQCQDSHQECWAFNYQVKPWKGLLRSFPGVFRGHWKCLGTSLTWPASAQTCSNSKAKLIFA